jgi:hypothetical protein
MHVLCLEIFEIDVSMKFNQEKEREAILNFFPEALGNELKPFLMKKHT